MKAFPRQGRSTVEVERILADARQQDFTFASGRILGSMCTEPHPVAVAAWRMFQDTNLGDPGLHPGATRLEAEAGQMLLALASAPEGARSVVTSGGSEANLVALHAARARTGRNEIVVPETGHFSLTKAANVLGMTIRRAAVGTDWAVDVDAVQDLVGRDTACIVGVAGTTEFGTVDPIAALSDVAADAGVPLHVDAAFGGLVIPFLSGPERSRLAFDFRFDGVTTIGIDPHKMGMVPIPSGNLLVRDAEALDRIAVDTPYVSTERQWTPTGTRPGAASAALHAVLTHLGRDGFEAIVADCMENARRLAAGARDHGVPLATEPVLNLVTLVPPDAEALRAALRRRGWLVHPAPLADGLRIVAMPHVRREHVQAFLHDLASVTAVKEAA